MTATTKTYQRFSLSQRVEHILMLAAFVILALTGLPQKFIGQPWAEGMIGLFGGIETTRIIHRVAATTLMLETVYHLVSVSYKVYVRRTSMTMLPGLQDVRDFWGLVLYLVGRREEQPAMGRYAFDEKVEYWSLVWGTLIMILTGFMLWNPISTTRFLPGQFIPAAKAAHGGEALLAVLAIIVWHMYHVHVRKFNKSMFTGVLTEAEMLHEHPRELAAIKMGTATRAVDPVLMRRRQRLFYPVAGVLSVALLIGLYKFVSFEQTAITTLPVRATVVVFAPQTPTPIPSTPTPAPVASTPTPSPDASTPTPGPDSSPAAATVTWDGFVGPLFAQKCAACHGAIGNLSLATYADAQKGGKSGPIFVAGNSSASLVLKVLTSGAHPIKLSDDELAQVKAWIDAGALEK